MRTPRGRADAAGAYLPVSAADPTSVKAQRKAAAGEADDDKIFEQTPYGRMRIPSFPIRLLGGIVLLVALPIIAVYRLLRRLK